MSFQHKRKILELENQIESVKEECWFEVKKLKAEAKIQIHKQELDHQKTISTLVPQQPQKIICEICGCLETVYLSWPEKASVRFNLWGHIPYNVDWQKIKGSSIVLKNYDYYWVKIDTEEKIPGMVLGNNYEKQCYTIVSLSESRYVVNLWEQKSEKITITLQQFKKDNVTLTCNLRETIHQVLIRSGLSVSLEPFCRGNRVDKHLPFLNMASCPVLCCSGFVFDLREFELESELEWKALNKPSETQKWYGPKARLKHFLSYFNKYTILGKLSLKLQIALVLPCTFFRQRKDRKDQDRNLPGKELHDIIEDSFWVSVASLTVLWHGKQIKMGNKDTLKLLRVDGDLEIEVS